MGMIYERSVEYKISPFNKVRVFAGGTYGNDMFFRGFVNNQYTKVSFLSENIKNVEKCTYKGANAVSVSGIDEANNSITIYLPGLDYEEIKKEVATNKANKELARKNEETRKRERIEREKQIEIEKQEREAAKKDYYKKNYLSIKEQLPVYLFEETPDHVTYLAIDESKNIVFRSIDKEKLECVESVIEYKDIHYYEKAGTIHYVSNIDFSEPIQSFAGSFVPAKVKLTPAVVGGLLFGPMGLAIGAMSGYKPAHFQEKDLNKVVLKSGVQTIDDRSVILNYYAGKHKQYMDVELPQDIYNFLQTHLAEKKYDIVLSVEKKTYGGTEISNTNTSDTMRIDTSAKMSLDDFEVAVKKLKIMFDNGLITEEEFMKKKTDFLNSI